MELQDFQNLLIGAMSQDQNQMVTATSIIQNLIETQYPLYIQLLLSTIQNNNNERIFNMAITLLSSEVRTKRIFSDPSLAVQIVQNLTPIIATILQSPNVKDNFKKIMAYLLAHLHIFVFHLSNNVDIPTYILTTFNQMPEIRKYLIYCIFEIALIDADFGGFSMEDLLSIITHNFQDPILYIPILKLFFSIAMRRPDIPNLRELFAQLFSQCPQNDLSEMLLSLSDFSEKYSSFFQPILGNLTQQLCSIAANVNIQSDIRNRAMICLSSISEGAPEMCQSSQEYLIPVFQTLIQVVSEINDKSPWEFDPNNTDCYQCALDSIGLAFEKFDNANIFIPIYQITMEILSNPNITWQAAYAVISSLAEINMIALSYLIDAGREEMQKELFEKIAMFLNIRVHPRARIAVYTFISKLSKHGILYPQIETSLILIKPLEKLMIEENVLIAKQLAYKAYAQFISQLTSQKISEFFNQLFPQLVKELQVQPDNFKIYIIRVIGPLVKAARGDAIQYFPSIVQIAASLMKLRDPNIRAEAIQCFSLAVTYVPKDEQIKAACVQFCTEGIPLLESNELDDDSCDNLYTAINNLLTSMGEMVVPIVQMILPNVIKEAQKKISIEQVDSFESNDVYKIKSLYYRVPSDDPNIKQYASLHEVVEVKHALLILDALLKSDPNFINYVNIVYQICEYWITNQFSIEPIKSHCWNIYETLLDIFEDKFSEIHNIVMPIQLTPDQAQQQQQLLFNITQQSFRNIECIFLCYTNSIDKRGSPTFISQILKVVRNAISYASRLQWFNADIFAKILQTLQPLIDYLFKMKMKKMKDMEDFHTVDLANKSIAHYDVCLTRISDIISASFKLQPQLTFEFYNQTIGQKTNEYLNNNLTLIFGITTTTTFIIYTKDKAKMLEFCEILIKYACIFDRREDDLPLIALLSMGQLFYEIPIENRDTAIHYMEFFNKFFNCEQIQNISSDEMTMQSDYANVTFAKFLHQNQNFFSHGEIVNSFLDAFPLFENVDDSDIYFQFMQEILEKGWFQEIYPDDWPEYILGHIISGYLNHQYSKSTRMKFVQTFRKILYTGQEGKQAIIETLNHINPNKARAFIELIKPKQQPQQLQQPQ